MTKLLCGGRIRVLLSTTIEVIGASLCRRGGTLCDALRQIMLEELKRPNYAGFDLLVSDQTRFAGGRGFTLQTDKVSTPAEPTGAGH